MANEARQLAEVQGKQQQQLEELAQNQKTLFQVLHGKPGDTGGVIYRLTVVEESAKAAAARWHFVAAIVTSVLGTIGAIVVALLS